MLAVLVAADPARTCCWSKHISAVTLLGADMLRSLTSNGGVSPCSWRPVREAEMVDLGISMACTHVDAVGAEMRLRLQVFAVLVAADQASKT